MNGGAGPNLARRPFVNARPVVRLTVLLWILGGLLAAANAVFVTAYLRGSAEKRSHLASLETVTARAAGESADLDADLSLLDIEALNERTNFVNRRIAERTFAWGRLFDDLSAVLPRQVRILGISPLSIAETGQRAPARRSTRTPAGVAAGGAPQSDPPPEFALTITGIAGDDEALLDFIDALFAQPEFSKPDLASEEIDTGGLGFSATTTYRPGAASAAGAVPARVAGAVPSRPELIEETPVPEPGAPPQSPSSPPSDPAPEVPE